MQWRIGAHRLIKALRFALLIKEAVLVALGDEKIKLEVAPRELHTASDRCPLAEGDRLALGSAIGQRIAANNVLLQYVSKAFFVADRTFLFVHLIHHFSKKSLMASLGVVGQDVDAIAGAYGNQAFELPFRLGFNVFQKGEFAAQNFYQEIAVAAGRLKETAVEPKGLVAHKVEHSVHLAWISEHLAVVSHSLAAFDLFCVFVVRHKKSWNFIYVHLGVPRPA